MWDRWSRDSLFQWTRREVCDRVLRNLVNCRSVVSGIPKRNDYDCSWLNVTLTNLSITDGAGTPASFPISITIDQNTIASVAENTTSQGLHLTQNCVYKVEIIN